MTKKYPGLLDGLLAARAQKISLERQGVHAETVLNEMERKRGRTRDFLDALEKSFAWMVVVILIVANDISRH
ncbi:hypothetical protein GJ697_27195 [Pseudoduganella sp. FT25W]|uniref:Uncharacterized protein n=1 Tax=Duganella alba TaxID=2666081 RepID=A0A6L5QPA0_9BURK|nr:hypothetical protein [Duganella alba]MRX11517.1 hypothetical protein [Duganella alba]MRX19768.1 hypothetical protein [Duganella alba]